MAEPMSVQTVIELAGLVSQVPPDQADLLVVRMRREQPVMYKYLLALARPPFNSLEHDFIFSAGTTIWQILEHSPKPPGQLTTEALARASDAFNAELEHLIATRKEEREGLVSMLAVSYPEPALLGYLVAVIRQSTAPEFDPEKRMAVYRCLKVLLDALLDSRSSRGRPKRPRGTTPVGRA